MKAFSFLYPIITYWDDKTCIIAAINRLLLLPLQSTKPKLFHGPLSYLHDYSFMCHPLFRSCIIFHWRFYTWRWWARLEKFTFFPPLDTLKRRIYDRCRRRPSPHSVWWSADHARGGWSRILGHGHGGYGGHTRGPSLRDGHTAPDAGEATVLCFHIYLFCLLTLTFVCEGPPVNDCSQNYVSDYRFNVQSIR